MPWRFVHWYAKEFEKVKRYKYIIKRGDYVKARLILDAVGDAGAAKCARNLLDATGWLERTDKGISLLYSQINSPEIRGDVEESVIRDWKRPRSDWDGKGGYRKKGMFDGIKKFLDKDDGNESDGSNE